MFRISLAALFCAVFLFGCTREDVAYLTPQGLSGQFVVSCEIGNRAKDDPIVLPGQSGASHSHDFFGAALINAYSTEDSMRLAASTCPDTPSDTAGYWVPTMYYTNADGKAVSVTPRRIRVYYRSGGKDPALVQPFPAGLKMVVGNAMATEYQPLTETAFACTIEGGGAAGDEVEVQRPPRCKRTSPSLRMKLVFPDCWDGVNLDSSDHKSHMARSSSSYRTANRCPAGWVAVPQITIGVRYWYGDNGLKLSHKVHFASMNSPKTYHGDFWNTWNQAKLEGLVRECINAARNCGDTGGPR